MKSLVFVSALLITVQASTVGIQVGSWEQSFISGQVNRFLAANSDLTVNQTALGDDTSAMLLTALNKQCKLAVQSSTGASDPISDVLLLQYPWSNDYEDCLMDFSGLSEFNSLQIDSALLETQKLSGSSEINALPISQDIPVLYYRKDLMLQYCNTTVPPTDWDSFEVMANKIQQGQRDSGFFDFWGFIWPAVGDESLTQLTLELIRSHGAPDVIDSTGALHIKNDQVKKALLRASNWFGSITPYVFLASNQQDAQSIWTNGQCAFYRGYLSELKDSNSISWLSGNFGIAPLPKDSSGPNSKQSGAVKSWSRSISNYGSNAGGAVKLMQFMLTSTEQINRFKSLGELPTLSSVDLNSICNFSDPMVVTACNVTLPNDYKVHVPSSLTRGDYVSFSSQFYTSVNFFFYQGSQLYSVDQLVQDLECGLSAVLFGKDNLPSGCTSSVSASSWSTGISAALVATGLLMCAASFAFVQKERESPIVKTSSRLFLNVLLLGVSLAFFSILVQIMVTANPTKNSGGCIANLYVGGAAFSLVVGSFMAKIYRLNAIFTSVNTKLEVRVVEMHKLLMGILAIYLIDIIISSIWVGIDPPMVQATEFRSKVFLYKCQSSSDTMFFVQIGWRGFMLLVGIVFAYVGRSVPNSFSEKRSVAFLIYNMSFFGILYLILRPVIRNSLDLDLIVQALFISIPMFATLGLWIGLKFWSWMTETDEAVRGRVEEDGRKVTHAEIPPASPRSLNSTGSVNQLNVSQHSFK
jgi:ABC-type glycerol-3-phosphate transport system substrate-binding protein